MEGERSNERMMDRNAFLMHSHFQHRFEDKSVFWDDDAELHQSWDSQDRKSFRLEEDDEEWNIWSTLGRPQIDLQSGKGGQEQQSVQSLLRCQQPAFPTGTTGGVWFASHISIVFSISR
mmetsp:Transcript_14863/g.28032  ORF Transcript_14863/g.28032 Transcript_14863/m.28032 type:complete len:119 (-) Transcript_14863:1700-2056(-)